MDTKIKWNDGEGYITATYEGSGDGSAIISSDVNEGIDRVQTLTVQTTNGMVEEKVLVSQEGLRQPFGLSGGGVFRVAGGGRFGVLKVGNPIEPPTPVETYTRLTYIECTGEQYINTGYIVQEDDVIDMDYINVEQTSADKCLFGVYGEEGRVFMSIYSNTAHVRFGTLNTSSATVSNARTKYVVKLQKGSVDIDGSKASPAFDGMPQFPLYLFACNQSNRSINMYGIFRTMGFKISKASGEVVMNLKPCKRDSDGKVGMLDLVSGQFFGNGGAGEDFIGGAEIKIADGYEVIDYVTFSKNKLYDLGIVKSTQTIEVMFARSEKSATPYLYGCVTSPHTASVTAYLSSNGAWRFGSSYKGLNTNNTFINRTIISNGKTDFNFASGTFTKSTFTTPDTVVLGGYRAASGSLTKNYQGKVFYIRITEGSAPIIDYYPCKRISDGVEGFWDCVSQTFIQPM